MSLKTEFANCSAVQTSPSMNDSFGDDRSAGVLQVQPFQVVATMGLPPTGGGAALATGYSCFWPLAREERKASLSLSLAQSGRSGLCFYLFPQPPSLAQHQADPLPARSQSGAAGLAPVEGALPDLVDVEIVELRRADVPQQPLTTFMTTTASAETTRCSSVWKHRVGLVWVDRRESRRRPARSRRALGGRGRNRPCGPPGSCGGSLGHDAGRSIPPSWRQSFDLARQRLSGSPCPPVRQHHFDGSTGSRRQMAKRCP